MALSLLRKLPLLLAIFVLSGRLSAQTDASTSIGGYGNAYYFHDANQGVSSANLERFVLFLGHSFGSGISLMSELEVEDAKLSGGEPGGELALEQAYLKFDLDPSHYLVAGLFIPRLGILNENHLPTQFNGNQRTQVETYIIPSTWRELGVGFYGAGPELPINYTIALMNGLNGAGFEHGSVLREGRYEGRNATMNNLALTGGVQYNNGPVTSQLSIYYGGTVGIPAYEADTLQLPSGPFAAPVALGALDVQYEKNGFGAKILGSYVSIRDAEAINRAYGSNTPQSAFGGYVEVSYNLLEHSGGLAGRKLILFGRYETLDMNATIPSNGIIDGTLRQQHYVAGVSYFPVRNIVIKADARILSTGDENPLIPVNADPGSPGYDRSNTFLTLGFGFSF